MSDTMAPGDELRLDRDALGEPQPRVVSHRGLEYPGEVIVAETVEPDWGLPLEGDTCFRVVLYTVPRRIPAGQIRDPRIAMAVPRRAPDVAEQSVGRQLQAIREARERYVADGDADSRAIRESMAEQETSLQRDLARREALSYSEGRIYTQSGLTIPAPEIFAETDPVSWVDRLVQAVHRLAYPTLPFDYAALPDVLDTVRIDDVFRGILQGDGAAAERVRGFGPALGISSREAPDRFDAGGCEVTEIIAAELAREGGEVSASALVQSLSCDHGLNRALATLYLLVYVLHAEAEVTLARYGAARLIDGSPLPGDRITWDLLREIRFPSAPADRLGVLRARARLSWNAVLPYATILDRELRPADDGAEVARQEERLVAALGELGERVAEARDRLAGLAPALGEATQAALPDVDRLQVLCATTGYRGFHEVALSGFGGPSALGSALDLFRRLERLAGLAPSITSARLYLDEMAFGAEHGDLRLARDSLTARIGLDSLLANPSLWDSIEAAFLRLRNDYRAAYLAHHARYHEEGVDLVARLEKLGAQVNAVSALNDVPEFGGPMAADVPRRFRELVSSIKTCTLGEADVGLDRSPFCEECSLSLDQSIPRRRAAGVMGDVEWALREYNQRLSSEAVTRILAHPSREQLDRFIDLVQVSDLTALANVMDARVLEFLRRFVSDGGQGRGAAQ